MEMSRLADTHPTIHKDVTNVPGCWTYQRNNEFGFNGLAADQTIETTINKDSKTAGGITGFTRKSGNTFYNTARVMKCV